MLGILVSRADDASVHIGEHLRELLEWEAHEDETRPDADGGGTVYRAAGVELREFEGLHIDLERPATAYGDVDLLAVASKHAGETGPLLTAHHTGNAGPADHGGEPNSFARACPNAHARVYDALRTHAPEGYEVGMECSHHGPTDMGAPSMFVELGSDQKQWDDPEAAQAVARAMLDLRGVDPDREPEDGAADNRHRRHLVGVGGGHYAPRFERVLNETDWTVGHVVADWGLDALGDIESKAGHDVLAAALSESRATYALVDGNRPGVAAAVEAAGGEVVGETWVRETDGVPLGFVDRVERAVAPVEEGLRFGERARGYDDAFTVVALPEKLLDEARGIDRERTADLLAAETLAYCTDQGGTRPTNPVVLADEGEQETIVDGLVDLLRERYDSIEHEEDAIVARKEAFSAEKARTLGVPEGPKFGRLSAGQAVEVDGETIPPAAVCEQRERRFPLEK